MSGEQLTEVCALFNKADVDMNGSLDIGEVKDVIMKAGKEEIFAKYFADEEERLNEAVSYMFETVFKGEFAKSGEISRDVLKEVLAN